MFPGVPGAPVSSGTLSTHLPLLWPLHCCPQAPQGTCPTLPLHWCSDTISQSTKPSRCWPAMFPPPWQDPGSNSTGALLVRVPHCPQSPKQPYLSLTPCKVSPKQPLLFPASRDSEPVLGGEGGTADRVLPPQGPSQPQAHSAQIVFLLLGPNRKYPSCISIF